MEVGVVEAVAVGVVVAVRVGDAVSVPALWISTLATVTITLVTSWLGGASVTRTSILPTWALGLVDGGVVLPVVVSGGAPVGDDVPPGGGEADGAAQPTRAVARIVKTATNT